jgi:type I restriction enzyme S subunit
MAMIKSRAQTMISPRFKPYPAYKDSGVEWLGEIPTHWGVSRADAFLRYEKVQVEPSSLSEELIFHYSIPSIQDTGDGVLEPPSEIASAKLRIVGKRLLVSKLNPRKGVVLIASEKNVPTICSTEFVPFQVRGCELRWALYLFLAESTRQRLSAVVRSATRSHQRVEVAEIVKIWHGVPPIPDQRAIAGFLDRETAKIDALVVKKERLIELLQEKRNALITQAVTKGLDPTVQMKDSGIGWFGNMPAHWEIAPLKRYILPVPGAIKTGPFGSQLLSSEMESGDIKVYNQRTAIDRDFDTGDNFISEDKFRQLASFAVQPRDILVTTRGTIGRCAIVPDSADKGILHPCLMRIQPDPSKMLREFSILLIQDSDLVRTQLALASNATTIDVIYSETMREVFVPKPPIDEQRTIIAAVNRETGKIDRLVARVHDGIDRLKEHRTALISAAVTGKIDVREEPHES